MLDIAMELNNQGKPDEAYEILKDMPYDPRAIFNIGWHEMRLGNLIKGAEAMYCGRYLRAFGSAPPRSGRPEWKGQDISGRKILLHGEGGFGDEIINVRFAKNLKDAGAYVTVSCHPALMPLFRTIPYIDALVSTDCAAGSDHDYWVPAMSAILPLDIEYADLSGAPYIPTPDPIFLPGNIKVGLKFSGNPQFEHEQHRKFPPELMTGLQDIPGITFYSLQKDDIPDLGKIVDLSSKLNTWLDTARFVSGLDLVITSCTGIAHLASALGVPAWVIIPVMPYYIWAMPGEKSPWYDSVHLYRQRQYGCWKEPFNKIRSDLNALCKGRKRKSNEVSLYRQTG